ncbi:nuclear envelope integral membrane protein [Frankliniella occidentalis]|uniref:Nuclear envelope integral membrane protein n=1 Tax=Frankliniella occidentalis TaxID=133901 RepID=A0A6J1T606_FRAOC|nr:nuclear envelope integral membrane protein [Frankliniella occidentalis]
MYWSRILSGFAFLALVQCVVRRETSRSTDTVQSLLPGEVLHCCNSPESRELQTYCYSGRPKHILHLWQTVILRIKSNDESFELYEGDTPEAVRTAYDQHRSSWGLHVIWGQQRSNEIKLPAFNRSCIGVSSSSDYSVHLLVIRVDYWRVLQFVCGLLLFFSASRLSENYLFYYISCIALGMTASAFIVTYFISKLLPAKKFLVTPFLVGGSFVYIYIWRWIWENLRFILVEYRQYVLSYFGITGLISFVICYRYGPITDKRSKNLIKWSLQIMSVVMVLLSSQFQEATIAIVLLLFALYKFPRSLVSKARSQWIRRFPPKPKLLSEDQYYEQGVRETQKALDELRGYCSSPDCNQWKTVLRIKDPVRFAKFVEGKSHLDDNEVLDYEIATPRELEFSDESESDSDSVMTD